MKLKVSHRDGQQTRFIRGVATFLATLLLVLSLGAGSADFHHALHGDQSRSSEHSCAITLIRDGGVDFSSDLDLTINRVSTVEFLDLSLADSAPCYVRPRLIPWASGPPLIS